MSNDFTSSADYFLIETTFKSLWQQFDELANEMDSFVPYSPEEFIKENKHNLLGIWKKRGANQSREELEKFVDQQLQAKSSFQEQFHNKFGDRFMSQFITVIFISHALCEAIINTILATEFFNHGNEKQFHAIERKPVLEKWEKGLKKIHPNYELAKSSPLYEALKYLTLQRNALTHYKISLESDNAVVYEGSKFQQLSYQENILWAKRFFSLPYDLAAHIQKHMLNNPIPYIFSYIRSPIPIADAHA